MIFNKDTAEKTAELLLQINAIKLNPKNPFTWASGWHSPIYCDNRLILSFPPIRNFVREEFSKHIEKEFGKPDVPFVYVRPEPKKHGRQNQVEGFLQKGQNVVVVEDLISTGNSSLLAVEALKEAGAHVKGMVAIFTYGFDVAVENFKNANVTLNTLADYEHLLHLAVAKNYITENELATLQEWRKSPSTWNV
jgi:orotate phosphoribosyltransferase